MQVHVPIIHGAFSIRSSVSLANYYSLPKQLHNIADTHPVAVPSHAYPAKIEPKNRTGTNFSAIIHSWHSTALLTNRLNWREGKKTQTFKSLFNPLFVCLRPHPAIPPNCLPFFSRTILRKLIFLTKGSVHFSGKVRGFWAKACNIKGHGGYSACCYGAEAKPKSNHSAVPNIYPYIYIYTCR